VPRSDRQNRPGASDSAHLQSRIGQFHAYKTALGPRERTRKLETRSLGHAPEGLRRFRFTGERAPIWPMLPAHCFSMSPHRRWSHEMLQAAEIDERLLPSLHESPAVCGKISGKGQRKRVCVLARQSLLVQATKPPEPPEWASSLLGRSAPLSALPGVVFAATDRPALDPLGRVHTFCHGIPGRWHVMGVTQAAGSHCAGSAIPLQQTPAAPANPTTSSRPERQKSPPVLMVSCGRPI